MIRFFVYENLKHWLQDGDYSKNIGTLKTAMCGATAGAASVFGNTPIDVVKTRMQVSDNVSLIVSTCVSLYRGLMHTNIRVLGIV